MGRVKTRRLKSEIQKESIIAQALKGLESGTYPSIRKAADITGIAYTTLQRRWHGGSTRVKSHEHQQLVTAAEERAIVRWIYKLEEAGFPPRTEHVREAVLLLHTGEQNLDSKVGKNWITRFLNRHPELVAKFSAAFDKKRIKASNPKIIMNHFQQLGGLIRKFNIPPDMMFNMDEKGFMMGRSDRCKVICGRRGRGMTGKLAQDGNRELVTVIETICGNGTVLPPLVIYKGTKKFMGWYQHLDDTTEAAEYLFATSPRGWTSRKLGMEWLKHFDQVTKPRVSPKSPYRLLIIDGHDSHITMEFIKYCLDANIKPYCLPPHTTHLLQPLDVGLFSPLQKAYGKGVDKATRFSYFNIWKGNFLLLLIEACQITYTKDNILGGWRGAGLIPINPRIILGKLPQGQGPIPEILPTSATPKNSSTLLRHTRQAKLMLKNNALLDRNQLLELIEGLEHFSIAADKDRVLERATFAKWQDTAKLEAQKDKRHIGKGYGEVIDGKTLARLYKEREAADLKKVQRKQGKQDKSKGHKQLPSTPSQSTRARRVTIQSPDVVVISDEELEPWDTDSSSSSSAASTLSVITVATPLPTRHGPHTPHTPHTSYPPLVGLSQRSRLHFPSISSPLPTRVTRSRSKLM